MDSSSTPEGAAPGGSALMHQELDGQLSIDELLLELDEEPWQRVSAATPAAGSR
jgi:hypothetical protein